MQPMITRSATLVCVAALALTTAGCGGKKSAAENIFYSAMKQAEEKALLPEIDIVQLKENSDEALKLAQEAKLEVQP